MRSQWRLEDLPLEAGTQLSLRVDSREQIPFTVVVGKRRSPVALVIAGVHGDEYEGPAAIQDFSEGIDPRTVDGAIILAPVANPAAFSAATRRHPVDDGDLNRSFPGRPDGTPTEQLAHLIFREFVQGTDCILSLHGWSKEAMVMPYAEYPDEDSAGARMSCAAAHSLGFSYLHPYKWPKGALGQATAAAGIPIVETEIGGAGTITVEGQKLSRDVIRGFLGHFGIVRHDGGSAKKPILVQHSDLICAHAGLFRSSVEIGEEVSAGQQLGYVRALNGSIAQSLHAPHDGLVAILRTLASVQPGNILIQLFRERGAS